jgi:hypothetical protein
VLPKAQGQAPKAPFAVGGPPPILRKRKGLFVDPLLDPKVAKYVPPPKAAAKEKAAPKPHSNIKVDISDLSPTAKTAIEARRVRQAQAAKRARQAKKDERYEALGKAKAPLRDWSSRPDGARRSRAQVNADPNPAPKAKAKVKAKAKAKVPAKISPKVEGPAPALVPLVLSVPKSSAKASSSKDSPPRNI